MSANPEEKIHLFLKALPIPLKPFSEEAIHFCKALSQELFALEKVTSFPDIASLAYWLRESHIAELQQNFEAGKPKHALFTPHGLAFHIAPANVETIFVYSWVLSLLAGNFNVVRLPSVDTSSKEFIFKTVRTLLEREEFEQIERGTLLFSYGHEEEINRLLSQHADLRIIWGGDATVATIQKFPTKLTGKEVVFVDRYAYALLNAETWLQANEEERQKFTRALYNDIFYFEQRACSSTRALFWIGTEAEIQEASHAVYTGLQALLEQKEVQFPTHFVLKKQTHVYDLALGEKLHSVRSYSNELSVVEIEAPYELLRDPCGGGLLFHVHLKSLQELQSYASRKDQTLTYFGFKTEEMEVLAHQLNGKGFDRIVPVGQALEFNALWDGYDLLREFTRVVTIL